MATAEAGSPEVVVVGGGVVGVVAGEGASGILDVATFSLADEHADSAKSESPARRGSVRERASAPVEPRICCAGSLPLLEDEVRLDGLEVACPVCRFRLVLRRCRCGDPDPLCPFPLPFPRRLSWLC